MTLSCVCTGVLHRCTFVYVCMYLSTICACVCHMLGSAGCLSHLLTSSAGHSSSELSTLNCCSGDDDDDDDYDDDDDDDDGGCGDCGDNHGHGYDSNDDHDVTRHTSHNTGSMRKLSLLFQRHFLL